MGLFRYRTQEILSYSQNTSRTSKLPSAFMHHRFEEKRKTPSPAPAPFSVKANGATVIHRPSGQSKPLPLHMRDYEGEDYYNIAASNINTNKRHDTKLKMRNTQRQVGNTAIVEREDVDNTSELVHYENLRLRRQIQLERNQNEKDRIANEKLQNELVEAQHSLQSLQRTTKRLETFFKYAFTYANKMVPPEKSTRRSRRMSMGSSVSNYNSIAKHHDHTLISNYEHKLQILLNEIDALETEELHYIKKSMFQKNENDKLGRALKHKEEIIEQLSYTLQYRESARAFV